MEVKITFAVNLKVPIISILTVIIQLIWKLSVKAIHIFYQVVFKTLIMPVALTFMEPIFPFLNEEFIEVKMNQKSWIKNKQTNQQTNLQKPKTPQQPQTWKW